MSIYRIRKYPESILRKQCKKVDNVGLKEKKILEKMVRTMHKAQGVGLAASQVGIDQQLIVVDVGEGLVKLINPLVLLKEGESTLEEGCLSLPGVTVKMKRSEKVMVQGWDESGKMVKVEGEGLFAHTLQHEIDHLWGVLIIDYVSSRERADFRDKLMSMMVKRGETNGQGLFKNYGRDGKGKKCQGCSVEI
ncbi:peptide deformylase [Candidatus Aerophobetes bacterium]|uniref:Peptide deformylase n=1 Tax=Aerophobetes bacterium TaxID=2030807 RepID=A0A523RNN2_UNCAE|nr:MAG: peptide deformylase [Candidatus Aerophobetes bacterium]